MTLSFTQIYYKDEQIPSLYEFAKPYKNETLTDYFENWVIAKVVPAETSSLIGVCSHRLSYKRSQGYSPIVLRGDVSLTEEKILSREFDVAILTPHSKSHKVLASASVWHGTVWDEAFAVFKRFLSDLSISVPEELTHAIYENHFIAKREIYHQYVAEALTPSIEFMRSLPIFKSDSGYNRKVRPEVFREYQSKTGYSDYPITPFILERLLSIWIEKKNFNVINL